jgi:hypothetical protein
MFHLILHGMDQSDFGSQATCEMAIGEIGHKVRSKKAPFAIATLLFQRANRKMLVLQYPSLIIPPTEKRKREHLFQSLPIQKVDLEGPSEYYHHLTATWDYLEVAVDMEMKIQR